MSSESDGGLRARRRGARIESAGGALLAAGLILLGALQYFMPSGNRYPGPVCPQGARDFASFMLGRVPSPMLVEGFVAAFEACVVIAWIGYALCVYAGLRYGISHPWRLFAGAMVLGIALAVAFPTSLTHDPFAYLGYGRMAPVYGLNPYSTTLASLVQRGDAFAGIYPAPHPSPYGPLWTLLTSGFAGLLRSAAPQAQVIALRLVQAASVFVGALGARWLANAQRPGAGDVALVAFALNPLLLIEGPANGHNDLLMVALLIIGTALVMRGRWKSGFLIVGASIAVKFVSVAMLPMLLFAHTAGWDLPRRARRVLFATGLATLPVAACFAPFWQGPDSLAGVTGLFGQRAAAGGGTALHLILLAALYVIALVWLSRGPSERLPAAWSAWSALSLQFAMPGTLPWYFSWPMGVSITKWDRASSLVSLGCVLLSFKWMLSYVMLR